MANRANSAIEKVAFGGYILEECDGAPELILIGTGTKLGLCVQAAKQRTQVNCRRSRRIVRLSKENGLERNGVTMNHFGASAPVETCLKELGFTVENVIPKAKQILD